MFQDAVKILIISNLIVIIPQNVFVMETTTSPLHAKNLSLPAKCALCSGNQPANYWGCPAYKNFQSTLQQNKNLIPQSTYANPIIVNTTSNSTSDSHKMYAQTGIEMQTIIIKHLLNKKSPGSYH